MKLVSKQRLQLYKDAIEYIDKHDKQSFWHGFCYIMWDVAFHRFGGDIYLKDFPELLTHKPLVPWTPEKTGVKWGPTNFWFCPADWQSRKGILMAIVETMERRRRKMLRIMMIFPILWLASIAWMLAAIVHNRYVVISCIVFSVATILEITASKLYKRAFL